MEIKRKVSSPFRFLVFFSLLIQLNAKLSPAAGNYKVKVGVILDMGSWTGKSICSCISMAVSDFYASKNLYGKRIVLHTRDSTGDPMQAISAALDLLVNVKVKVIIGPETHLEGKFLAVIASKFHVPIFSLSSIVSSPGNYPFLVQIKQDETIQFKGITAVLKSYQWKTVNLIYEESDDGREILSHLFDPLKEANIHIAHRITISPLFTDDQILNDLRELYMQPANAINLVHMSTSLASRLFPIAKRLGMMKEGYAWIITDRTMNPLHMLDSEVIESMQGALGFKAYIPASSRLRDITLRWRKEFYAQDPSMELIRELDVLGIWAYDALWALAESIESVGVEFLDAAANQSSGLILPHNVHWGKRLLNEIAGTRFRGLSGEFQILNGKLHSEAYTVVNVIGKGVRRVGFWTPRDGIVKDMQPSVRGRHILSMRRSVIWPGDSTIAPKGWLMPSGGKKVRIVVVNNPGFKELVNVSRDPLTNTSSFSGFCVDVFLAAIKSLDYEVPYEFVPYVDEHGKKLGSYSHLIYEVYLQKYDGAVGDITITANRSLYVDFTLPFTDLGVGYIGRRESNGKWFFLKPLRASLWVSLAGFFVWMGLVVWIIEHPTNEEFQGSITRQIGTILWFSFSTLVYAHRERLTSNLSRFVVIVWLFVVLILTSSYTATLSSMLTVKQIQLASDKEYLGTRNQNLPILAGTVKSNLNFKDNHIRLYQSPEELAQALSRGSKKGGVAAIFDEIPYVKIFLGKYGADFDMVASDSTTNGFAFVSMHWILATACLSICIGIIKLTFSDCRNDVQAFQKGSPLVSDMSRAIMKLRDEGTLAMMEKARFMGQSSLKQEDAASTANVLNLYNFGGLFLLSSVSSVLALLLHLIIMLLKRLQSNNSIIKLLVEGKLAFILRFLAPRNNENEIELVNVR